ncbi:GNAT family N-acetyltransferase [Niveibacterium microcysteis]|uniref:GNAT family N-acetyltransferase n=1 Tax=Niveibacterium microcysteis TaxID=2811415 RepID=A0ABX7M8C4_9RHOO|nr:GNAT family protein [Niveibacterium microcysteis]QSI76705.1 GNAT family N-acetyltransferase [Niveibacterium microcysteis]
MAEMTCPDSDMPLAHNRWISLRPPLPDDLPALLLALKHSRRLHHPWVRVDTSETALTRWVARSADADFQSFVAFDRTTGAPAAVFNLSQIFYGPFCNAYLGYYALAPYLGHGWTRAALPLLLKCAFGALKLHRIEANIQPGNLASIALVEGGGFRREGFSPRYLKIGGRWRDHLRYAITAEDWRGQRAGPRAPTPLTAA